MTGQADKSTPYLSIPCRDVRRYFNFFSENVVWTSPRVHIAINGNYRCCSNIPLTAFAVAIRQTIRWIEYPLPLSKAPTMGPAQDNLHRKQVAPAITGGRPPRFIGRTPAALLLLTATLVIFVIAGVPSLLLNQQVAACLARRRYETAEQWLNWCHRLQISNAETTFLNARLSRKQLQLREVPPLLQQALQQGFDRQAVQREYLLLEAQAGRLPTVINELNRMLTQDTHDGAEICEAYVNGAAMMGSVELAETIISSWKQAYPNDPQPFYARARILEYQQRSDEALAELNTAIRKDPRHWPSVYARSRMASAQGRLREALADAVAAATGMKCNSAPLLQQARCLLDLAEPVEARQVLEQIQSRPPQDLQHSFNLVCEPERGLPLEVELGRAEAALGQTQQAVGWFDKVLARDPRNLSVRYERAICLRELGQSILADSELQSVQQSRQRLSEIDRLADIIREQPELPHVAERCRIGELFLLYDDARRGEFWLKDALNHDPQYEPAHRLLTDYYDSLAREDAAWKILADQHRAAPGDADR